MIEQVQKLQKKEQGRNPIWSRVEAKVLDAQVLDGIKDASISHITGTMVYNLVANGRQALEAAHRVLQPEGVIGMTLGASGELMDLVSKCLVALAPCAASTPVFICSAAVPSP
jgi:ubiquinone/menaquinone biosynthesis C-methylase UbiE